jgi:DnaJ-class molecular chaperone
MSQISEFEGAVMLKISPQLLRWFTSHAPKKDKLKLNFKVKDGVYYYSKEDLDNFNRNLNSPWPKPVKGQRPIIPQGIQQEIKKEAGHCCTICRTNVGELAHIEPVVQTLNNHPHNLIYVCPNHHTVYDYGHIYNNVTKEDVLIYKKALLTFQVSQWKLQGNLIASYISAINLIGRIQEIENEVLKCISLEDFEDLFTKIVNKIDTLKKSDKQSKQTNEILNEIDEKADNTNKEKAYRYLGSKSKIVNAIKEETNLIDCKLCSGHGFTEHFDTCPACAGEGLISLEQSKVIDFDLFEMQDCPLCDNNGFTEYFDTCPPCNGTGVLSKEQTQKIDFEFYEIVNCSLCEGRGFTDFSDSCPPCDGKGSLTKEQIQNIDFEIYEVLDCPLCKGKGHTDFSDSCPPCVGKGSLTKEQIQKIDFEIYEVLDCPLCEGRGHTAHFDNCPPCNGTGSLTDEQIQNIDFDNYDLIDCPLCNGKGYAGPYDTCPPCQGAGKLSKEQVQQIDFDRFGL